MSLLHYQITGPEGAPALVFVHGFPFSGSSWDAEVAHFSKRFRCVVPDLRGMGQSPLLGSFQAIEGHVDDLWQLCDALKLGRVNLCGLSMGGYIALRAIERNPERVERLILCDTRAEADGNEAKLKRWAQTQLVRKVGGMSEYAEGSVKALFWEGTRKNNPVAVEAIRRVILNTSPLGIGAGLSAMAGRTDTSASLAKIRVPTLIVVGEHDAVTPVDAAKSMHEKIAGSQLEIIPAAGHLSNLENPEAFHQALDKFFAKA